MQVDQAMLSSIQQLQADIGVLRQLLLGQASESERAEIIRQDRVREVITGNGPVSLTDGAKIFLHVLPINQPTDIDLTNQQLQQQLRSMYPLNASGGYSRVNFDGFLRYDGPRRGADTSTSYVQVFRNGAIEFCDTRLLRPYRQGDIEVKSVSAEYFEGRLIATLKTSLAFLKEATVTLPIMVLLSLTTVKGYVVNDGRPFLDELWPIDRENLFPTGQLVEQWEQAPAHILKPIFDSIANAGGFPKSQFYDDNGDWKGSAS